jgi:catechol 2,3-dioxygenase
MQDFYARILGLSVSDRGHVKRYNAEITFMSSDPKVHHQVILCQGRPQGAPSTVNQLAFTVGSLDELKEMHRRVVAEGIAVLPLSHGNAWSIYFNDPEGNNIEIYLDSPFHIPQPYGEPLDLSLPSEEIVRRTEEEVRKKEGFMSREEWAKRRERQMG